MQDLIQTVSKFSNDLTKLVDIENTQIDVLEELSSVAQKLNKHKQKLSENVRDSLQLFSAYTKKIYQTKKALRSYNQQLARVVANVSSGWLQDLERTINKLPFGQILTFTSGLSEAFADVKKDILEFKQANPNINAFQLAMFGAGKAIKYASAALKIMRPFLLNILGIMGMFKLMALVFNAFKNITSAVQELRKNTGLTRATTDE